MKGAGDVVEWLSRDPMATNPAKTLLRRAERGILTEGEVRLLVAELRGMLPLERVEWSDRLEDHLVEGLRFGAVATRCREAREKIPMNVAEVAKRLRTAQYRIQAVDSNRFRQVDAIVLRRYVDLLGLRPWFRRWEKANRSLMETIEAGRS